MTETTQACMAMHDLYTFSKDDVSKHGKEGEDCRKSRFSIQDEKRNMIDFQPVREIVYTSSTLICVCDDYYLVSSVDQLGGKLVDVTFNPPWRGKEEITNHSDVVRHVGGFREGESLFRCDATAIIASGNC